MSNLSADRTIASQKPEFCIRIVVCDSYLTKPAPGVDVIYSDFRGSDIKQVPILRIFGATPDGKKACLHVHGVFPYFYLPCPTPNPAPQFLYQIATGLDKALNIALKQATSTNQHVYKISLVKGLPFYGFHDKDHLYLKVFLYNPGLIKQAVELCSNGAILGQAFQPHESHLNFTLQFFIDFNLFGMSNIDLQVVKFRKSGISQNSNEPLHIPNLELKPESICYYEVDCMASHIMNRQRIGKGDGIENPGLEEVWNQEMERRKQLNVSMSKSLSQLKLDSKETDSHYRFQQMFLNKLSNILEKPAEVKINEDLIHYPAESLEGSQLLDAIDVSMHLPEKTEVDTFSESMRREDLDNTLVDQDETLVDENVALNSSLSLHYSQVFLEKEDLELVDLLQDMDEKIEEEDSILMSPAFEDQNEDDDIEYSQIFNEETLLIDPCESNDSNKSPISWNDTFWDTVHIPQLDGTCDDDHVKKVRKRKMRSFKLGLSKPKKNNTTVVNEKSESKLDVSEVDEINASRETIEDISNSHLRKYVKPELQCELHTCNSVHTDKPDDEMKQLESITYLVQKHEQLSQKAALLYDREQNFQPTAGPSNAVDQIALESINRFNESFNNTSESSPEEIGIMSFYNTSKLFDASLDNSVKTELNQSAAEIKTVPSTKEVKEGMPIILCPLIRPPTKSDVIKSLKKYNIPIVRNPEPYFSNPKDVGDKLEIGQMLLKLRSKCAHDQKPYERVLDATSIEEWRQLFFLQRNEMSENSSKPEVLRNILAGNRQCVLEPVKRPPTRKNVMQWLKHGNASVSDNKVVTEISKDVDDLDNSQAIGLNDDDINKSRSLEIIENDVKDTTLQITMQGDGSFLCFGSNKTASESSIDSPAVEVDFLTMMVIEVHASSRGDLHPNPITDTIQAVFITITNDCPTDHELLKTHTEIIVADPLQSPKYLDRCFFKSDVRYVNTEYDIIEKVIELVKTHDPDIMCGYEIEMSSWGYFMERAQVLGVEIVQEFSRITEKHRQRRWRNDNNDFEGKIIGRIVFNVWRLFRHELALSSYSFENCMYEILKERVPLFDYAELTKWWQDESRILRWIPVEYYLTRLSGTVRMLEKLDIINRTSELARLFGLQWWEVLSRGSQFRVESLMLRAARPLNLIALSPSIRQRAAMRAPECLPLILEPESRFYTDPVIVLDFQSLYPSMMIAYNYCFSTCIGRVQNINCDSNYEFGAWRLRVPGAKLETLVQNELVHWSPVGVGFVKPSVRRGVLPALLRRILAARQAVKKGMKLQTDEGIKKAMHSRQLGLKLIANVTYGYTAANFSGRMPCVEVGDSVVAKGRETLQRAIDLVMKNSQWNAKVIYGDTDSMFVLVPGRDRAEAFRIGRQIADAVTDDNPAPVVLKLEKVYQPCILQTKKRYVGFMYESADQEKPVYEAKGIETVRRDGCPAGVKLLQSVLCELFTSGDMSRVKRIVTSQLSRIADGTMPLDELFFSREYHGPNGYKPGASAPPNEIAKRISARDARAVPRRGQRVRWAVCAGAPRAPLLALAAPPAALLARAQPPLVAYYVARVIVPPVQRCLALLGADVYKWWAEVGRSRERGHRATAGGIARYLWRARCAACGARGARALCARCGEGGAPSAAAALAARGHAAHARRAAADRVCESCSGHFQYESCKNTECPIIWKRLATNQSMAQLKDIISNLPPNFTRENFDF